MYGKPVSYMYGSPPRLDDLKNDPEEDEKLQKAIIQSMRQTKRKTKNFQEGAKNSQAQQQQNVNNYQPIAIQIKKCIRTQLIEPIKNNNKNMSYEIKRHNPSQDQMTKYTINKKQTKQINHGIIKQKQKQTQSKLKEQNQQLKKLVEQLVNQNEVLKNQSQVKIKRLQQQIKLLKNQIQKDNKNQSQNIGLCKACLYKPATYANIPCMHVNLCNDCAKIPVYKKACITCNQVGEYKKIFLSSIPQK